MLSLCSEIARGAPCKQNQMAAQVLSSPFVITSHPDGAMFTPFTMFMDLIELGAYFMSIGNASLLVMKKRRLMDIFSFLLQNAEINH